MTPAQIFLIGFIGGIAAFVIIASISTAFILFWINRAPFFDEDEYIRQHNLTPTPSQENTQ